RVELEREGEPRREIVNVMNDKNKTELENNEGILSGPQRKGKTIPTECFKPHLLHRTGHSAVIRPDRLQRAVIPWATARSSRGCAWLNLAFNRTDIK
ncbi:hypothetical protein RRG08_066495, partial [Elysia crispata]